MSQNLSQTTTNNLTELARLIRHYIVKASSTAGSGHPTSSLSAVELMTSLFFDGIFRTDLENPKNPNNDRLIFSKGHASPLFYGLYAAAGRISFQELETYRDFDSRLEGHPSMRFEYTEAPTGSLGQGLGIGVGMAMAGKIDKLDYRTYVLLGDSEIAEGSVWEAASLASYYKLDNLVAILDVNRLGQRGQTMFGHNLESYKAKFEAFGWQAIIIDGHDLKQVSEAYKKAMQTEDKPTILIAKTLKGKGVSFAQDQDNWHGKPFLAEQYQQALEDIGEVDISLIGKVNNLGESTPLAATEKDREDTNNMKIGSLNLELDLQKNTKISTRKAYGLALEKLDEQNPQTVVLDSETSNSTYAEGFKKYQDRFIECFIAEQNMVSVALGLDRRGKIPLISTFAAFFSRAFDQIRMSQYANSNIKFVGSHCGVSIGEDGFSQMALEDIAMFRAVSEMTVLYPSDGISCAKLVEKAVENYGNFYIRTTRADTDVIYDSSEEFPIGGSKTLFSSAQDQITIIGAGITLHETIKAYHELKALGISVRVIDLYSIKPLDIQTLKQASAETKAIIVVEDHYREGGIYEAICSSGVIQNPVHSLAVSKRPRSGKPAQLLAYEEIDAKAIVEKVKQILS